MLSQDNTRKHIVFSKVDLQFRVDGVTTSSSKSIFWMYFFEDSPFSISVTRIIHTQFICQKKGKADLQGKVNGELGLGQDVRAAANST